MARDSCTPQRFFSNLFGVGVGGARKLCPAASRCFWDLGGHGGDNRAGIFKAVKLKGKGGASDER